MMLELKFRPDQAIVGYELGLIVRWLFASHYLNIALVLKLIFSQKLEDQQTMRKR